MLSLITGDEIFPPFLGLIFYRRIITHFLIVWTEVSAKYHANSRTKFES